VAVHDAWAPYDSYIDVKHQLCCAHAQRELVAVTDAAGPDVDWCWATQTHDALVTMQKLVADAIATGADTVDSHTQPRKSTSTAARSRSASPPPQPAATR
jgi:transposase